MLLKHVGIVDSENWILLFADVTQMQTWQGSENEIIASDLIGQVLDNGLPGATVAIRQSAIVAWSLHGSGTVDVFADEASSDLVLVRVWLSDADDEADIAALARIPATFGTPFAEFEVTSGHLAFFWSAESGDCIQRDPDGTYSLVLGNMMSDSSGLILPCENGTYQCFHDEVEHKDSEARRCFIVRQAV